MAIQHVESQYKIYVTQNYDMFKILNGNRNIENSRVKKIKESIQKIGYLPNAMLVNEKLEIIDGQSRWRACKEKNIPIYYIIVPGLGTKECIELNINQKNWSNRDYIQSYSDQGLDTYTWLLDLQSNYPNISLDDISGLAYSKGNNLNNSSTVRSYIRGGQLSLTDAEKRKVEEVVDFLFKFSDYVKDIGGKHYMLYNTILYCHNRPEVDDDKLLNKVFDKNWSQIRRSYTVLEYLTQIEKLYNTSLTSDKRIYLESEYKKYKDMTQN